MSEETIKIIEYITGSPVIKGVFVAHIIGWAILALIVIAVFVITFFTILKSINNKRRWK